MSQPPFDPLDTSEHYGTALGDMCDGYLALRPPRRMTVSEGAADALVMKRPGDAGVPWSATDTPYMVEPMNMLASRSHNAVVFVGPAQSGKCLSLREPIPTPSGWVLMGDIVDGDELLGTEGLPIRVLEAHPVLLNRRCYRVEFSDGTSIVADAEHLWTVEPLDWHGPDMRAVTVTTEAMAGQRKSRFRIRNAKPLTLPKIDLPVDPYALGVWLAGGDPGIDSFEQALLAGGISSKSRIPQAYLRASLEQRASLFYGLMDTNGRSGSIDNVLRFSTTNTRFCEDFCELARTLGASPCATFDRYTTWRDEDCWKLGPAMAVEFPVGDSCVYYRIITSITEVDSEPVRCIRVDAPDNLFLAGDGMVPTHNTAGLLEGWMAHALTNDPGDMLIVQMTEAKAREYSKQRIDRALRHSPKLHALVGSNRQDNIHDKLFRHGMWLRIAWPSVTNLSSTSYRYVALTDYDRLPDDIDGEGDAFSLGLKRTTTFMTRGMCAVESSPGRIWSDPTWRASAPHEAPPVGGILGIYNRSDRRRWYWSCPDCKEWFEAAPGIGLFNLPPTAQLLEDVRTADLGTLAKEYARVVCPHCGSMIESRHRYEMNRGGRWVPEGVSLTADGEVVGTAATSTIAGYWLGGVAAAYQSWDSLINKHLQGLRDFAMTGNEESLRVAVNTDQAMPYLPMHLVEANTRSKPLEDRGDDGMTRHVAPEQTRCLVAAVDVQGGSTASFVVQIHAVGSHMEQWLVDRYEIRRSEREGMGSDKAPIDPATYTEDWDVLTQRLLRSTWRTPDPTREIKLRLVVVDTGGEDGATWNAYAWFRRVRNDGHGERVMLYKGAPTPTAPILKLSRVGKRGNKDKGDIPLYVCNPNLLSDGVDAGLRRTTPGPGYLHFPPPRHPAKNPNGWLSPAFFDELKAEQRGKNGRWYQVRKRNESFDLCRMIRAGMLRLGLDKIRDWNVVPAWLAPLELNSETVFAEDRREMKGDAADPQTTGDDTPPPPPVRVRPSYRQGRARGSNTRRSAVSPYLK